MSTSFEPFRQFASFAFVFDKKEGPYVTIKRGDGTSFHVTGEVWSSEYSSTEIYTSQIPLHLQWLSLIASQPFWVSLKEKVVRDLTQRTEVELRDTIKSEESKLPRVKEPFLRGRSNSSPVCVQIDWQPLSPFRNRALSESSSPLSPTYHTDLRRSLPDPWQNHADLLRLQEYLRDVCFPQLIYNDYSGKTLRDPFAQRVIALIENSPDSDEKSLFILARRIYALVLDMEHYFEKEQLQPELFPHLPDFLGEFCRSLSEFKGILLHPRRNPLMDEKFTEYERRVWEVDEKLKRRFFEARFVPLPREQHASSS